MQQYTTDMTTKASQELSLQTKQRVGKAELSSSLKRYSHPLENISCRIGDNACAANHVSVIQRTKLFHSMNERQKVRSLLKLQRRYGNRFVQRVIAQQAIQTKLRISRPRDVYEQEAERVARWVLLMPKLADEQEKQLIQTRENMRQIPVEAGNNAVRGGGQPLPESVRAFFEPRFGYSFSHVRIHRDTQAAYAARMLNARAFTMGSNIAFGAGQYVPDTSEGRSLLAHELTHVVQQKAGQTSSFATRPLGPNVRDMESISENQVYGVLQRDLAVEPPAGVPEQPDLTEAQVRAAIRYNRATYDEESTHLIRDLVGAGRTGGFDETTVRVIALYQERYGLNADGKVGPDTYDLLIRELTTSRTAPTTCLTLFQIVGPQPLRFVRINAATGGMESFFRIRIRFDPRCNCGDWQYRQYIAGSVILHDVAGPNFDLSNRFTDLPAGRLTNTLEEDGDTSIPAGVAGHHYGHRRATPNPGDGRDRYLPNRRTGCVYEGSDTPDLGPIPAAPGDAGDRYDWNLRFRGAIIRRGHGTVQEKYWTIRGPVVIP